MSHWVIHRNQSDRKLYIDEFDNESEAQSRRNDYIEVYHDVIIVDQSDINELYLRARKSSTKKIKNKK